jgi:large subunit ribosomal protein L9
MKLILTQQVAGLGDPGDVVDVKDGYARNFLIPRKLGTPWTKGGEKQVTSIRRAREARSVRDLDSAKDIKSRLENGKIRLAVRSGEGGRLFGAVTVTDIVEAVTNAGVSIDKRRIEIGAPIKTVGDHKVTVRVHPEVLATVTVEVVPAR